MKSVWIVNGQQRTETTTPLAGETKAELIARHTTDVWARWQNGEAPDDGTTITTSWPLGEVPTEDTFATNRAWMDAHIAAITAAY